jgi:parallel beta-helix repeat protein
MNRKKVLSLLTIILLIITIGAVLFVALNKPIKKTLVVPDDYAQVSWALGNATAGDTVYVKSGTYNERGFVIGKPLSLIGEDSGNTILIGGVEGIRGGGSTISISADNVTVSGFTIRSYNFSSPAWYFFGIYAGGNNLKISGNIIERCQSGIWTGDLPRNVSSVIISQNTIRDNLESGIEFDGSPNNITITDNSIATNILGIAIVHGDSSVISENNVINNRGEGIYLGSSDSTIFENNVTSNRGRGGEGIQIVSSNGIVSGNYIADNQVGVTFSGSNASGNVFYNNSFVNNDQNVQITSTNYTETWDNGSLGNYWSDYATKYPDAVEVDNTGIWNTPYAIDGNNKDNHPLMTVAEDANNALKVKIAEFKFTSGWGTPAGVMCAADFNVTIQNLGNKTVDGLALENKMLDINGNRVQPEISLEHFGGVLYAGEVRTIRGEITSDIGTMSAAWALGSVTTIIDVKLGNETLDELEVHSLICQALIASWDFQGVLRETHAWSRNLDCRLVNIVALAAVTVTIVTAIALVALVYWKKRRQQ